MRYTIWDKESPVITPIGEVLTAEEWKDRYPVARLDTMKIVCGGGDINGSYFGVLSQMIQMYEEQGCTFENCNDDQSYLDAIEAFEDERNTPVESDENTAEERIAAALEYQNILSMETVNTDDPDEE